MRTLLVTAALVAALAACGGDDDDTGDTSVDTSGGTNGSTVPPVSTDEPATTPDTTGATSTGPTRPTLVESDATITPPGGSVPETGPTGSPDELAAIADLASREGVDESAITVVSTQEVTWRDGSIGCPEPGVIYTQALVPGVRVVLELDGVRYHYHAGGGRSIFLCENPRPPLED